MLSGAGTPLTIRHSTQCAEERAGQAAVRNVPSAPLIAMSKRWPLDDQRIPLQNHSHRRQNRQKPRAQPTKDRLIPKTSLPNRHDYHLNHCFLQSPVN